MLEFLPDEIRQGLVLSQQRARKRKSRLRVHFGDQVFPVLRLWEDGLTLDADHAPNLRGLVDIYDGAEHIFQCLVIASFAENGEVICDFKRSTAVTACAPLDFWKDENAPVGYLSRN